MGVEFPLSADGRRSTTALGRSVVADALRRVDAVGAGQAERETSWRTGYLTHFRRLVEAGLPSRSAALTIAGDGLASLHRQMRFVGLDGDEAALDSGIASPRQRTLATVEVRGSGEPEPELSLPYRGRRLRGDDLMRQLDAWVACGAAEPSCAEAVRKVVANPEWLRLSGHTVVALGAGSEVGPLGTLLRWGARVAGVDLRRAPLWQRVLATTRAGAGTLLVPVSAATAPDGAAVDAPVDGSDDGSDDERIAEHAGLDLVSEPAAAAEWLQRLDGRLVLGNYVYADGADNVRVAMAVDGLTVRLQEALPDLALAFLATPTDVFAVPADAVTQSTLAYASRSHTAKLLGRPLRTLTGGRLLSRAYVPGVDPGVNDSLVPQQGPNYALAKRLQRWRATLAREGGSTVSLNVAPPTRTRSVVKNRALAAAYAGAHRFGVEVFEPDTCNVLMAALLVHDVHTGGGPSHDHPWQDEAYAAVHGGLWRAAYAPRSSLGLAALLGYTSGG